MPTIAANTVLDAPAGRVCLLRGVPHTPRSAPVPPAGPVGLTDRFHILTTGASR
jgi:hypothetical protein